MFQNRSFPTNFALFSNPADFEAFVFFYWNILSNIERNIHLFKQAEEKRKTHVPK